MNGNGTFGSPVIVTIKTNDMEIKNEQASGCLAKRLRMPSSSKEFCVFNNFNVIKYFTVSPTTDQHEG